MSDDIVTRLRGEVIDPAQASYHLSYELDVSDLCKTAADEIESLRWGLETSKHFLDQARNGYQNLQKEIEHLRKQLTLAYGRTCRCVNTGETNES